MTGPAAVLFERSRPSDPARDYCLWTYDRPAAPTPGALRSSALLYYSFACANVLETMVPVARAIATSRGPFNTVWGLKWANGRMSWEFYCYDYALTARRQGFDDLRRDLAGVMDMPDLSVDHHPYFMFSIEVAGPGAPDRIDLYLGTPGAARSSGKCYGVSAAGVELRNIYNFYQTPQDREAVLANLYASMFVEPARIDPGQLIWPEMEDAPITVVANKRANDGLYFSRITVGQLLAGLDRTGCPAPMVEFLRDNTMLFAHHLFDLGYDYVVQGARVIPVKGSFYGLI